MNLCDLELSHKQPVQKGLLHGGRNRRYAVRSPVPAIAISIQHDCCNMGYEIRRTCEKNLPRVEHGVFSMQNKPLPFRHILTCALLKRTSGLFAVTYSLVAFWRFFPETCKFPISRFYLHVDIIMMNFYAGFSRCGCIFIHTFSLSLPLGKSMWYLQPFSGRNAGLLQ